MDKRGTYRAGVIAGALLLVSQYVFAIDFGLFIWAIALMTLSFAVAFPVTPAEDRSAD